MPHVRIETSVPRHPKFLKAGPVACWLWLCGNCYCQDGLTDGFIPREVVPTLGLPVNRTMLRDAIAKLVEVRLWETREGGWQVHDYLEHNRSADHVRTLRATNTANAKKPRKPSGSVSDSLAKSLSDAVVVDVAVVGTGSFGEKEKVSDEQVGADFQVFQSLYPAQGRMGGPLAFDYFRSARLAGVSMDVLVGAVANHKASAQWQDGKIPQMARWLQEQRWLARLDPPKSAAPADSKLPAWAQRGLANLKAGQS